MTNTDCGCFATSCETVTQHCPDCNEVTDHHVAEGVIQPIIFSECEECGRIDENVLMTPDEIYAEALRGF